MSYNERLKRVILQPSNLCNWVSNREMDPTHFLLKSLAFNQSHYRTPNPTTHPILFYFLKNKNKNKKFGQTPPLVRH